MSNASPTANRRKTEEIPFERWIPFLTEFTRANAGAHARLEITGAGAGPGSQVETENRPFTGISADVKDRERTVWIVFGTMAGEHLTHGIQNAASVRVLTSEGGGPVLEVEAEDGTKSILELNPAGKYELPPGGSR